MELSASAVPSRMARRLKVISGPPALFVLRRYLNPAGEAFDNTQRASLAAVSLLVRGAAIFGARKASNH